VDLRGTGHDVIVHPHIDRSDRKPSCVGLRLSRVCLTEHALCLNDHGLLATLDDGASENVAPPYGAPYSSSPESSKVAKIPARSPRAHGRCDAGWARHRLCSPTRRRASPRCRSVLGGYRQLVPEGSELFSTIPAVGKRLHCCVAGDAAIGQFISAARGSRAGGVAHAVMRHLHQSLGLAEFDSAFDVRLEPLLDRGVHLGGALQHQRVSRVECDLGQIGAILAHRFGEPAADRVADGIACSYRVKTLQMCRLKIPQFA